MNAHDYVIFISKWDFP